MVLPLCSCGKLLKLSMPVFLTFEMEIIPTCIGLLWRLNELINACHVFSEVPANGILRMTWRKKCTPGAAIRVLSL